jgi:kynurenine formamidase
MQKIDLSIPLTGKAFDQLAALVPANKTLAQLDLFGHIGTHIDLMGKEFDLARTQTTGRIFDVRKAAAGEITLKDFAKELAGEGEFIMFLTGRLQETAYGEKEYFLSHKELAWEVIEFLVAQKAAMIGVDTAGVRKIAEHPKADQFCAEHGIFVVENMDQLDEAFSRSGGKPFTVQTYPLRLSGATGLPCRVIAEI